MTSNLSIYTSPQGEQAIQALYDAALARWPVPYQALRVATRHGETHVIASGAAAAPPLLLLHGAGSNATMWIGDVAEFSRGHRVYVVDLIGEPGRSAPSRPAWEGPAYAEWLEDVLAELRIERARLVGLSQGGWTALKFAAQRPERVEKLVLLSPGGLAPDRQSFVLQAVPLMMLGRWGIRRLNRLLFGDQPVPEGVDEVTHVIMSNFKSRLGVLPLFSDEAVRQLTMPVLLIMGERDALRPAGPLAARLKRLAPHAVCLILPGAGHALVNLAPRILAFLDAPQPVPA